MRFHFDSEDREGQPEGLEPTPLRSTPDHQQRVEFLRLVHDGMGRTMACAHLGIETNALRRVLAKCPAFRAAVEHVEQVRADNLYTGLYVAALNGDTRAATFLLSRDDRGSGRLGVRRSRTD